VAAPYFLPRIYFLPPRTSKPLSTRNGFAAILPPQPVFAGFWIDAFCRPAGSRAVCGFHPQTARTRLNQRI
jgi:hypothetical protein